MNDKQGETGEIKLKLNLKRKLIYNEQIQANFY